MIYVISHANCMDGTAAAYAAWRQFRDNATYLFCRYDDDKMPEIPDGAEVWFLDFFRGDWMEPLFERGCHIKVRDHHESAMIEALRWLGQRPYALRSIKTIANSAWAHFKILEADWERVSDEEVEGWIDESGLSGFDCHTEFADIDFSMSSCGAELAWEEFNSSPPPDLIRYVGDRDRWVWALPDSEAVSEGLMATLDKSRSDRKQKQLMTIATQLQANSGPELSLFWGFDPTSSLSLRGPLLNVCESTLAMNRDPQAEAIAEFELVDSLVRDPDYAAKMIEIGEPPIVPRRELVEEICREARLCTILGHVVPLVLAEKYASWVGHRLLELYPDAPFAAVRSCAFRGILKVELRSRPGFRVNRIAYRLGGGGHPTAAGFRLYQYESLGAGDQYYAPKMEGDNICEIAEGGGGAAAGDWVVKLRKKEWK